MFLASQVNEFLIIAIVAILVIAIGLLIYYVVTGRKLKNSCDVSPNFETKNIDDISTPSETKKVDETVLVVNKPILNEVKNDNQVLAEKNASEENTNQKEQEEVETSNSIQTLLEQMQSDLDETKNDDYAESINRYEDDEEANAINP